MDKIAISLSALLACISQASGATSTPPLGRLPDTITPTAYRLDLTVDPSIARFSGHTQIDAVLRQPSATIFLHGNGLKVTKVRITAGEKTYSAHYSEVDPSGVARLDLPSALPAGKLTLQFDYSSEFRTSAEGLFRAKVGGDWYAWTQMEPIDARRVFPGFDEPGFKTPFTVNVTAPKGAKVFANAPETGSAPAGSMTTHHFAATKPLPTYLVAIGVGPFDVIATTVPANAARKEPLAFRVIATKGQTARMQYALAEAPKLLGLLENYFGTAYPFEKLDFLASPLQNGAMENAGLIIFGDSLILLDKDGPIRQQRSFGEVSAHEMAHQWFGDLVTPSWWTDIWLNESFAEWMGVKISNQWRPDLGIAATQLSEAFNAMDTDALGHGRPIHQTITKNTEIASAFDSITYEKGAQVLSMFESYLGADNFAKGVRLHLSRHRYANAAADDFFKSLGEAAGNAKVVPAMRTFTDQTGVPVVKVESSARALTLTQTRYRLLGAAAGAAQVWTIPMCLARGAKRSCTLLERSSAQMAALPDVNAALMPDVGGAGYYRFSLDAQEWGRLIRTAPSLPGPEAMAVADNLWADFAAGSSTFAAVIDGARALSGNPERLAAIEMGYRLQGIADTMLKAEQLPGYRRLMGSIYAPRLATLGVDVKTGAYTSEPAERRALRESLVAFVALQARDLNLRTQLDSAAAAYLGGDSHALDPAFRRTALSVAVQLHGTPVMKRLKDVLVKSSDPQYRLDASFAVGSADTASLASEGLSIALSPGVATTESFYIIYSLSSRPVTREVTAEYVQGNLARILKVFPGPVRPYVVKLFEGYCEPADAARIDAYFQPKLKMLGGGELELAQAKEQIGVCSALKNAKGAEIVAAFSR
jgi:hypothetical protein